jgi:CO/xanthine dehydrogenase FAD-binding subunit
MYISDFNYHRPSSIKEACRILSESLDGAPLAGGTDLLVEMKQGLRQHQDIVSLMAIEELKSAHQDAASLFIGAGLTHNEIVASPVIKESFPAIAEAASTIGTDQVRNAATIGGNLCTGASCCDMAPILLALNAHVEISSSTKTRAVPLSEFFISHRETCIEKGEVMIKIIVPRGEAGTGACFEKFGLREAASVSVASVAVAMSIKDGLCADARVVIGAVAPTPKISIGASDVLVGKKISEISGDSPILKLACEAATADSRSIDDLRGSADYRQHLIRVLTKRALVKALSRASV